MQVTKQIAKHLRELYFGKNWTWSSMQEHLTDVTWEQAIKKVHGFNTIAALTYHIHYYVAAAMGVLQGKPLTSKDADSFTHPHIQNAQDWQALLDTVWKDAETFAALIEQLPDSQLEEIFRSEEYGTYYRNLNGIIEHSYYHLGQIVLVKKLVLGQ